MIRTLALFFLLSSIGCVLLLFTNSAQHNTQPCSASNSFKSNPTLRPTSEAISQKAEINKTLTSNILIVYPKEGTKIAAPSTFLVGSCPAGKQVKCNQLPVQVNVQGFFAHLVNLKPGWNDFLISANDQEASFCHLTIERESLPIPLPPFPLQIKTDSYEPKEDLGLLPGDVILLSIRATPGAQIKAILGTHQVQLFPTTAKSGKMLIANLGLDTAYGISFQRRPADTGDIYRGCYQIQAADHWHDLHPQFIAIKRSKSKKWTAPCRLTILAQSYIATTNSNDTVVRFGPGQARTTPLAKDVRLIVDGWIGSSMRCRLAQGHHVFIEKKDLTITAATGSLPVCPVRTINVQEAQGRALITVPLNQRLPYQIEQSLQPNKLVLKIFGATSDTDWVTQAPSPTAQQLVDHTTWKQLADGLYELTIYLTGTRQWGFWANYEGGNLILSIKGPPQLLPNTEPLRGLTVCLDPGHGGDEAGAIGPSGRKEADINFQIAEKLKELLLLDGAQVVMTRKVNQEGPSLSDRTDMAIKANADLLISIHNNALPDGRDPWKEHGTSTYWYHPQALELARCLKDSLVKSVGFPDFGVYYQNLALARVSQMPATLVEVGFMINPDEYAQLLRSEVQEKAAQALCNGIKEYVLSKR